MWKWIVVAVLAYVGYSMWGDRAATRKPSAKNLDDGMQKIAQELNAKLPMTVGAMRAESVTYSDRVMHYEGTTLPGKDLGDDEKGNAKRQLKAMYCGNALAKAGVGVEYTIKVSPTFNDTRPHPWVVSVGPKDCA